MKKLLLVCTLLIASYGLQAQMFGVGITAGPNFAFMDGKDFRGNEFVGGELVSLVHGGLIFQYRPRRFFSLHSGAQFVMKGGNLNSNKNSLGYGTSNNQIRLNYLEIPLFIKLNFDQYTSIRPNIFAGPTLGFMLAGRDNFLIPSNTEDFIKPLVDTERNYFSFDPGLAFGAGLDIDMGNWMVFTMGAQYVHGMRNLADTESVFIKEEAVFRNRNIRLNFGILFVIPTYTLNSTTKKDTGFKKFSKHVK